MNSQKVVLVLVISGNDCGRLLYLKRIHAPGT